MVIRKYEMVQLSREPIEYQLNLLRNELSQRAYPGYPEFSDRLVVDPDALEISASGRLVLPDGLWTVDAHPTRQDNDKAPSPAIQEELLSYGLELDSKGRPLHPWLVEMLSNPSIGVVTGKGVYWSWGPNRTVDPIVIKNGNILLVKRKDTGSWALPGGFIDRNEMPVAAALREVAEETGIVLPPMAVAYSVYEGPVADIRMTANAWPETSALLFQLDNETYLSEPRGADDASDAAWVPLEIVRKKEKLFGSHPFLLQKAIIRLIYGSGSHSTLY